MEFFSYRFNVDLILFGIMMLGAMLVLDRWVRRRAGGKGFGLWPWTALIVIVVVSIGMAQCAAAWEFERQNYIVSGFAPTYASEMVEAGIAKVTLDTKVDDPVYLSLIQRQIRWEKENGTIADIYTFVRRPDGKHALLVDSETDYDHDGKYEGEREQRTAIGELYEEDYDLLERVFAGESLFTPQPTADRWGVWISTYVPMWDKDGKVIGVLGVDYPADRWVHALLVSRLIMLGIGAALAAILLASATITTLLQAEAARRRQAEEALRASESRLRTIIDHEPECVMVVDLAGKLVEMNPAGMQFAESEVLGTPARELINPDHADCFETQLRDAQAGLTAVAEFEIIGRRGRRSWVESHAVPLRDASGRVIAVLSVARDVTARRKAEAEREGMQRQLVDASHRAGMAEIATGVLHNVGNVLNSVNVSTSLIAERVRGGEVEELAKAVQLLREHEAHLPEYLGSDEVGKQLPAYFAAVSDLLVEQHKAIDAEVAQLTHGIDHIKEIVRMQQQFSKTGSVTDRIAPAQLFEEALSMSRLSFERHQVDVERLFGQVPEVTLERHKVLQILINLISNALQAVKQVHDPDRRRCVTLRLSHDLHRGLVRWDVVDTGIGIPAENLTQIFQHGFTTRAEGHGFGLHSAANAAAEMGGTLTAHSDGSGLGARFTLELPLQPAGKEMAP